MRYQDLFDIAAAWHFENTGLLLKNIHKIFLAESLEAFQRDIVYVSLQKWLIT